MNMGDLFQQQRQNQYVPADGVNYEIAINKNQAKKGMEKDLERNGHRLRVKIPKNISDGMKVKLSNALATTDGRPGDILITVRVKSKFIPRLLF